MALAAAAIGAIGSLIGGYLNRKADRQAQALTVKEARRAEARIDAFNRVQMQREDTRLQRMMKDASMAGIHPVAALGAAGSYGGGVVSPDSVVPSFTASHAAGDAIASGAAHVASAIPERIAGQELQRRDLELELLRSQIGESRARAGVMLAEAQSRTLIGAIRQGAHGERNVLTSPLGDLPVTPGSTRQQEFEDQYGGIVGELYGLANYGQDLGHALRSWWMNRPRNPVSADYTHKPYTGGQF